MDSVESLNCSFKVRIDQTFLKIQCMYMTFTAIMLCEGMLISYIGSYMTIDCGF